MFDASGIQTDPAFVNAGGSFNLDTDFQVSSGGPTEDAGVQGIGSTDYFGNSAPSPNGGDWDIGVHEYQQVEVPAGESVAVTGVVNVKGPVNIKEPYADFDKYIKEKYFDNQREN